MGSLSVETVEFTEVVVPSTCKLPLTITVPSLLKQSGYVSRYKRFPDPLLVEIILSLISTWSTVNAPLNWTSLLNVQGAPVTCTLSVPFSSYSILAFLSVPKVKKLSSGIITSPVPLASSVISPSVFVDYNIFVSKRRLSTFHWSTFLLLSRTATIPPSLFLVFVTPAIVPGVCSIIEV